MSKNETIYLITIPTRGTLFARFKWTVSRGRNTYGYNICTLYIDGEKVAACNGGGYDMQGTCLGNWLAVHGEKRLCKLDKGFYGLSFHDPDFDPGQAVLPDGKTVAQAEEDGVSLGLDRYQQFHAASSKVPTERHKIPLIDGACGMSSVLAIGEAIGYRFEYKE